MYDIIGDIHGQAQKLEGLLLHMGYSASGSGYLAPIGRKAVFLGDLIDRGPGQLRVLEIVRQMVRSGNALCIMGNHEFNAIGWATPDPANQGQYLRIRSPKNRAQHAEFLDQIGEGSALHAEVIDWFKTLPPFLDLGGIRVTHAWWDPERIAYLEARFWGASGQSMCESFLVDAYSKHSLAYEAMEGVCKGLELKLPAEGFFVDHEGHKRYDVRCRWWRHDAQSYRDYAILGPSQADCVPEKALPTGHPRPAVEGSPIFIGHYWLHGVPAVQTPKVACLDYSAAKDGPLVAYRWSGETDLTDANLVWA